MDNTYEKLRQILGRLFLERESDATGSNAGYNRRTISILLGSLCLLSLVPRLLMAWKLGAVCDDGYHYLGIAAALEAGDSGPLFDVLNLNIYPPMLAMLHALGLDWLTTAKLWGALIGGLAVLPLFGWVRHLFDERVAIVSGFLYAVHPQFIELAAEPIREPTFWFLLMLGMFLLCRMFQKPAWWCPPAAGLAIALAAHTRSEGYLLLLPLLFWAAWHFFRTRQTRWQTAGRLMTCLSMTPLLLVAVNVTLLRDHPQWEWGRLGHFAMGIEWVETNLLPRSSEPIDSIASYSSETTQPFATSPNHNMRNLSELPPLPSSRQLSNHKYYATSARLHEFVERFVDAFEPIGLLLLVAGFIASWREVVKSYRAILLYMSIAVLAGVWIQFANYRIGGRYFLTVVLILTPVASLGLLAIGRWLSQFKGWQLTDGAVSPRLLILLAGLPILIGWGDALTSNHRGRERQAQFAEGLAKKFGPFDSILVNRGAERFGYHALGTVATVKPIQQPIEELITKHQPQLLILSNKFEPLPERQVAIDAFAGLGWTPVESNEEEGLLILRRKAKFRTAVRANGRSVQ